MCPAVAVVAGVQRATKIERSSAFRVDKPRSLVFPFTLKSGVSSTMSGPPPARRVRSLFMRFGLWTSGIAFVVIEGYALLDQTEIGHASTMFMLGTACLAAAACLGLFAIITAIGLAISAAFSDAANGEAMERPNMGKNN